jgi:ketosteroid isomerase-like protein
MSQRLIDEYFESYRLKDFDRMRGVLAEDMYFIHHNRGPGIEGSAGFTEMLATMAEQFVPDRAYVESYGRFDLGDGVVLCRSKWSATPIQDFAGFMENGKLLELQLCTFFKVAGERIVEIEDFG